MESRHLGGADAQHAAYGISTFTLKNLWAELVGDCHAASVSFSLPIIVYTRTSPLVLRLGDQVTCGMSFENEITARRKSIVFVGVPQRISPLRALWV